MFARSIAFWASLALAVNAYYPISNTASTPMSNLEYCMKVRSDCQSKPDANQSYCASLYERCAGTTSGLNSPPASSTASPAKPTSTTDCEKVRSDCQSKPDANQSYCASLYEKCAGTTSGLNKPYYYNSTMTHVSPTTTQPTTPHTTTTEDCQKVRSDCQSKPDANQSYCASLYEKCAGTTSGLNKPYYYNSTMTHVSLSTTQPATPQITATEDCEKVRSDCQSKPDANQSYCASLYEQCTGTTSDLVKPSSSTSNVSSSSFGVAVVPSASVTPSVMVSTGGAAIVGPAYVGTLVIAALFGIVQAS